MDERPCDVSENQFSNTINRPVLMVWSGKSEELGTGTLLIGIVAFGLMFFFPVCPLSHVCVCVTGFYLFPVCLITCHLTCFILSRGLCPPS